MKKLSSDISGSMANMSFLCAILIVLYHVPFCQHAGGAYGEFTWLLRSIACPIAVPWFFFASGFFLAGHMHEDGWWRNACRKRLKTILVPYLFWNVIWFVYKILLGGIPFREVTTSIAPYLNAVGLNVFDFPVFGAFWFLRMLLLLILVSPALVFLMRGGRLICFLAISALFSAYALFSVYTSELSIEWQRLFSFGCSLRGIFYFTIGLGTREYLNLDKVKFLRKYAVMIVFAGAIMGVRFSAEHSALAVLFSLCGTLFMVFGVVAMMPKSVSKFWPTEYAFPLYVTHVFVVAHLHHLVKFFSMEAGLSSIIGFSLFAIVTLLCSLLSIWLLRKLPANWSLLLWGGR